MFWRSLLILSSTPVLLWRWSNFLYKAGIYLQDQKVLTTKDSNFYKKKEEDIREYLKAKTLKDVGQINKTAGLGG